MAHTQCTERGQETEPESKWVTVFYAELFTLHWNRERDLTPLGFIQFFLFPLPLPFPVPCSVSEPYDLLTVIQRCLGQLSYIRQLSVRSIHTVSSDGSTFRFQYHFTLPRLEIPFISTSRTTIHEKARQAANLQLIPPKSSIPSVMFSILLLKRNVVCITIINSNNT